MKNILTIFAFALLTQTASAQGGQPIYASNPYPKTISVNGSAEMEIVPDEIYVQIRLGEYQEKGKTVKNIDKIKAEFLAAYKSLGMHDSLISIAAYSGSGDYYEQKKKKKPVDMLAEITYQVKFNSSKQMDAMVEKLDDAATKSFRIVSTSHSRITEFRKQLKIKAIQAARDKAIYLSEAVGEKLGDAITINEPVEWEAQVPMYMANSTISQVRMSEDATFGNGETVDFKKIKLKFDVQTVFALK